MYHMCKKNGIKSGYAAKLVMVGLLVTVLCISSASGGLIDAGPLDRSFHDGHNGDTVHVNEGDCFTVELLGHITNAGPWTLTVSDGLVITSHWIKRTYIDNLHYYRTYMWEICAPYWERQSTWDGYNVETITAVRTITGDGVGVLMSNYTLTVNVHYPDMPCTYNQSYCSVENLNPNILYERVKVRENDLT